MTAQVSALAFLLATVAPIAAHAQQPAPKAWQDKYVQIDGRQVHYIEAGSGTPIVLVHGALLYECAEVNYGAVIDRLAKHFHVYAVDLPGWGLTPSRGPGDYMPEDHGKFVIRFMNTLRLKGHLVGNSRAGWIVQYVAHEAPDLVLSLVIINSGSGYHILAPDAPAPRSRETFERPTEDSIRATLKRFYFNQDLVTDERVRRITEIAVRNSEFDRMRNQAYGPTGADRNRMLEYHGRHMALSADELKIPVLMTLSREDAPNSHPDALAFFRRLRDGEFHMFAHSGHHVQVEQAERWADVVIDFLLARFPPSTARGTTAR